MMERVWKALRHVYNITRNDPLRQMFLLFDFFGLILLIISIVDHKGIFNSDDNILLLAGFGIGTGNGLYLSFEIKRSEKKLAKKKQQKLDVKKNASDSSAFDKK